MTRKKKVDVESQEVQRDARHGRYVARVGRKWPMSPVHLGTKRREFTSRATGVLFGQNLLDGGAMVTGNRKRLI